MYANSQANQHPFMYGPSRQKLQELSDSERNICFAVFDLILESTRNEKVKWLLEAER